MPLVTGLHLNVELFTVTVCDVPYLLSGLYVKSVFLPLTDKDIMQGSVTCFVHIQTVMGKDTLY